MSDWIVTDDVDAIVGTSPMALPPICVECGRECGGERENDRYIETTLYWFPRWIWFGLIWGIIPAVLLYYASRRPLRLGYALCEDHVRWQRRRIHVAWGVWTLFLAVFVGSVVTHGTPALLIATIALLVIALVASMMSWSPLRVAGHEDGVFGVKGFSREFLHRVRGRSPRA
jgi:hypothetical protein